ncbi:dihydrofolate reductase family protein [Catenibacterium sp.]|uniref:dihydrofolate reductase family protein n=1 Tax=Catenibacterium sp. TaxID=2049022 RepID=UPI003FD8EBEA
MAAGGGYMNYSFAQENLIDELSIIIAPVTDGNTTSVSIFEKGNFLPLKSPISFALKDMNAINQNVVWLRYMKY